MRPSSAVSSKTPPMNKQRHDGLPGRDVKAPAAPMRSVNKSKLPGVAKPNPTITA
jgi:hypothetical protein